jgi:endonuclease YncB( thermonuclease family)
MRRKTRGTIFLAVVLLAIALGALHGWDRVERTGAVKPDQPGSAVGVSGSGPTSHEAAQSQPQSAFSGKVVRVLDGDTIDVMHDGRSERIRLNAVDCPEKGQAFGTRAKEFASSLVFGQTVTVHSTGRDRYGRTIADVVLPDGRSLNQELVKAGMAWWYRAYSKDKTLESLESEARSQKRGLWSDAHPVAPWEWRRSKRSAVP